MSLIHLTTHPTQVILTLDARASLRGYLHMASIPEVANPDQIYAKGAEKGPKFETMMNT